MKTKASNKSITIIFSFLMLSCSRDNNFPVPNRCGATAVTVYEEHAYDFLFGQNANQLKAGDISSSLALQGGGIAWFVNNALLNNPAGDIYLHNCMIIEHNGSASVKYDQSTGLPRSFLPETGAGNWYTINNAIIHDQNYELIVSGWKKTGAGAYDFMITDTRLVFVDTATLGIVNEIVINGGIGILWGSAILQDGNNTYIYGAHNRDLTKEAFVARIPPGSLTQAWSFSDGYDWTDDIAMARPVLDNVSDQYSVFCLNDRYYMVSQSALFGQEVNLYRSDHPGRDWNFNKTLYCRSGVNDDKLSANTIVHSISNDHSLVCSYSLIDKGLASLQPAQPVFIEIKKWE